MVVSLFVLKCVCVVGLDVMVGVFIYYLMLNEFDMGDYCIFFCFILLLCVEDDWLVMIEVVVDGMIDVIVSFYMF